MPLTPADFTRLATLLAARPSWSGGADGRRTYLRARLLGVPGASQLLGGIDTSGAPQAAAESTLLQFSDAGRPAEGASYLSRLLSALAEDVLDHADAEFVRRVARQVDMPGNATREVKESRTEVELKPEQWKPLEEALLSAFPNPGDLRRVVRFGLQQNIDAITGGRTYADQVSSLVEWVVANGGVAGLVRAARQENSGNPRLRAIAQELGLD